MKRIQFTIIALFLIFTSTTFAQGEASNWYFGNNVGLHFDIATGTTTPIPGSALSTNEGSASISDPNGNLLFYTDGSTVWNRNNAVMPNGTGLNGDNSSTQSGIIVPNPNDANIYYVFTVDEPNHNDSASQINGLNYTVVNMSLDGGNGAVDTSQKNIPLITYDTSNTQESKFKCSEKITAVKSGDCNSFWVVTHFVDNFYSFNVSAAGVNTTAVVTNITPSVPTAGYRYNAIGCMKISPDGSKLAIAHHSRGSNSSLAHGQPGELVVYDFDDNTGIVSNAISLANGPSPYGVEFSLNSKRVYATVENIAPGPSWVSSELLFFNLEAANIPASMVSLLGPDTINTVAGSLQLGPDGNIYRSMRGTSFLSTISNADSLAPTYTLNTIALNGTATFGLPPFIQSLFVQPVDIIQNGTSTTNVAICDGDSYTLTTDAIVGATYTWTFNGTPITTTAPLNEFIATNAGTYHVDIDLNNGDCPFYGEAIITLIPLPTINPITPLEACFNPANGLGTFTLSDADTDAINGQTNVIVSYHDNLTEAQTGINPLPNIYNHVGGTIFVHL